MRTAASTRGWCALGCALVAACTASAEDVRPPPDQLFFPSGLVVAPDDSVLFVANANSELRYDSGSISVINLAASDPDITTVESVINAWTGPSKDAGSCTPDPAHRETLICDAKRFMKRTLLGQPAAVRIGNFSTDIALQDFTTNPGGTPLVNLRLFVPTRGDPSVAWADYNGDRLSCTSGSESFALCDDAHRLQTPDNDLASSVIPDEPYNVFADAANGFAIVTHLTNGAVTLIDSNATSAAQIADIRLDVFAQDPGTGLRSATGVAGRTLGPRTDDIIYVGSRSDDRIQTFTVGHPRNDAPSFLVPGNYFFLDSLGAANGNSLDTRGVQFSPRHDPPDPRPNLNLLYVVNRRPPSVQIFDTSIGPDGLPLNRPTGASDICPEASMLAVVDTAIGERAYITCFQDGTIYVVDPRGQSQVEDIITVGRGPFAIAASQTRQQLFISNFLEDTIAVVDVNPASVNKNRVVLRIGIPRAP
jgi:DNA-binding beta-propeller fold protein YncE